MAGKEGLNLAFASRVVLVEPHFNPMHEEQAIDRTHRFGQRRTVHAHKLFVPGVVLQTAISCPLASKRFASFFAINSATVSKKGYLHCYKYVTTFLVSSSPLSVKCIDNMSCTNPPSNLSATSLPSERCCAHERTLIGAMFSLTQGVLQAPLRRRSWSYRSTRRR